MLLKRTDRNVIETNNFMIASCEFQYPSSKNLISTKPIELFDLQSQHTKDFKFVISDFEHKATIWIFKTAIRAFLQM